MAIVHGEGQRYVMSVVTGFEIRPAGHGKSTVTEHEEWARGSVA